MAKKYKKTLTLENNFVDASEYSPPPEEEIVDDLVEEFYEPEPEIILNIKPVKKVEPKIAIPTNIAENLTSAKAVKTCSKYMGGWIHMKAGKPVTDTKENIAHLRAHGLVE